LATTYLATGKKDIIVTKDNTWIMENGVDELQRFIGTGDVLGALIAALLGVKFNSEAAVVLALSYLNICAEYASNKLTFNAGLADFRHETLNQLSLLGKENKDWFRQVRGGKQ
ncbi:MAG: hydroxyethylthiazole kinase, partial [Tetragenococcus koreensis]|nr:hydroxyethylthiazole kinase [Tetragenococcus koreensis]